MSGHYELQPLDSHMDSDPRPIDDDAADADHAVLDAAVVRRLDFILLPFLAVFFLVNSLDRSNVGNAETAGFTADAGLRPHELNISVALFFAVFVSMQPIGAALGRHFGMVRWIPSCMLVWGFLTAAHVWIRHAWQLYLVRIAIGLLESSFYPVTVAYMSNFYTRYEFARRLGIFYGQYAIAGALGGVLSYFVFTAFPRSDDPTRWKPWQILFLIEGVLTIILAAVGFFFLPHGPDSAWFLTPAQRRRAALRLLEDRHQSFADSSSKVAEDVVQSDEPLQEGPSDPSRPEEERAGLLRNVPERISMGDRGLSRLDIVSAFVDWKIWYLLVANILSAVPASAFGVFLPLVVKNFGFSATAANLFTAPPFLTGAMVLWAFVWFSDRRQERLLPILYGLSILLVGLTAVLTIPSEAHVARYIALCVLLGGSFVASPLTIAWLAGNIPDSGKRSIVLGINGWGNLSGVFSALLFSPRFAPHYAVPFFVTLSLVLVAFIGFLVFRWMLIRINARRRLITSVWTQEDLDNERAFGTGPAPSRDLSTRLQTALMGNDAPAGRIADSKLTFMFSL